MAPEAPLDGGPSRFYDETGPGVEMSFTAQAGAGALRRMDMFRNG